MTLGGLLKHLALVEADYFAMKLLGRDPGPPWNSVDWDADPNWEWRTAAEDTPEELYALWEDNVARARANLAEALADGDPGRPTQFTWPDGRTPEHPPSPDRRDRGVRPAHRPRRPPPRGYRRPGRRGPAAAVRVAAAPAPV